MGSSGSLAWLAVIVGAIVLFWAPVIVAAARGTQQIGLVVLLTLLTPAGGLTWFAAWVPVILLPTRGQPGLAGRVPAAYPWTGASLREFGLRCTAGERPGTLPAPHHVTNVT